MTGASWASSEHARRTMIANRRVNTGPELRLRRELHRRGLRYRVDARPIRGVRRSADVVFVSARIAVFVDGCFWHGCDEHRSIPKTNAGFWETKIGKTRSRDRDTDNLLTEAGWRVVRVWEHDDVVTAADEIETAVRNGLPDARPR